MKRIHYLFSILLLLSSCSKSVYLFSSFHEPASEGLRFLYSTDGYKWTDLNRTFLKPEIGNQKVMRDPSIAQGKDGTFHLVWTSSHRTLHRRLHILYQKVYRRAIRQQSGR